MAYKESVALPLLKARMDRADRTVPQSIETYWKSRLIDAKARLEKNGVKWDTDENSTADNILIADYAAWMLTNRDSTGKMPEWLRLEIRERFIRGSVNNVTATS